MLEAFDDTQYEKLDQDGIGVELLHPEFVPVVFASSRETAEHFQFALERHGIPALIEDNAIGSELCCVLGRGIPILVPEHMHDQASAIIAREELRMGVIGGINDDDADFLEDEDDDDDFDDDLDDLDDDFEEEDDDLEIGRASCRERV